MKHNYLICACGEYMNEDEKECLQCCIEAEIDNEAFENYLLWEEVENEK